jgi:predicted glycoside hydrolase/deacetylase ChbG (UPF0249 family)
MVPSLVDEAGYFWHQSIFEEKVNLEEVYNEWDAQIIFLKRYVKVIDICEQVPKPHLITFHFFHERYDENQYDLIRCGFGTCSQISITFT